MLLFSGNSNLKKVLLLIRWMEIFFVYEILKIIYHMKEEELIFFKYYFLFLIINYLQFYMHLFFHISFCYTYRIFFLLRCLKNNYFLDILKTIYLMKEEEFSFIKYYLQFYIHYLFFRFLFVMIIIYFFSNFISLLRCVKKDFCLLLYEIK